MLVQLLLWFLVRSSSDFVRSPSHSPTWNVASMPGVLQWFSLSGFHNTFSPNKHSSLWLRLPRTRSVPIRPFSSMRNRFNNCAGHSNNHGHNGCSSLVLWRNCALVYVAIVLTWSLALRIHDSTSPLLAECPCGATIGTDSPRRSSHTFFHQS